MRYKNVRLVRECLSTITVAATTVEALLKLVKAILDMASNYKSPQIALV